MAALRRCERCFPFSVFGRVLMPPVIAASGEGCPARLCHKPELKQCFGLAVTEWLSTTKPKRLGDGQKYETLLLWLMPTQKPTIERLANGGTNKKVDFRQKKLIEELIRCLCEAI
jgi:hypothetical protein